MTVGVMTAATLQSSAAEMTKVTWKEELSRDSQISRECRKRTERGFTGEHLDA